MSLRTCCSVAMCFLIVALSRVHARPMARTLTSDPPQVCHSGLLWSQPRPLEGIHGVARDAAIAGTDSALYVLGTDIRGLREPVRSNPLIATQIGRSSDLPRPDGTHDYVAVRAILDSSGALHIVWGDHPQRRDSTLAFRWLSEPITQIWTATYQPRTGWSTPEVLASGVRLRWRPSIANGGFTTENVLGFAAPLTVGPGSGIGIFVRKAGRWMRYSAPATEGAASVAVTSHLTTIYMAYLAADAESSADVNSVFLTRSTDDGVNWSRPSLVSRSGKHGAYQLNAVMIGTRLHLIWAQEQSNGSFVLRHTESADEGRTWSKTDDVDIPQNAFDLRAIGDACGHLQVVYIDFSHAPARTELKHLTWMNGWSDIQTPFPALSAHNPALAFVNHHMTALVFLAERKAESAKSPQTYLSFMTSP